MTCWTFALHGGAYDRWTGDLLPTVEPTPKLFAWECSGPCVSGDSRCPGHGTRNADDPAIDLRTVEAYELVAIDLDTRHADYTVGDGLDDGEERDARELVGAGRFVFGGSFIVPAGHVWPWEV